MTDSMVVVSSASATATSGEIPLRIDVVVPVSVTPAAAFGGIVTASVENSGWYIGAPPGTYDILTDRGSVVNFDIELKDENEVPRGLDNVVVLMKIRRRKRDVIPSLTLTSEGSEISFMGGGIIRFTIGSELTNALDKGDNVYKIVLSQFNNEEVILEGQFNVDRRSATLQFDNSIIVDSAESTAVGGNVLAAAA